MANFVTAHKMSLCHVNLMPTLPSSCRCCCYMFRNHLTDSNRIDPRHLIGISVSRVLSKTTALQFRRWILHAATETRVIDNAASRTNNAAAAATVEIPVTCYQLIGVPGQAEKDEIVKSVMQLKKAEVEEGYTMDAVNSRQDLLMDVRDKLLFEPEFAGNLKEKIPPKSSLQIPWAWLPAALCLLQEVGEAKLVLDIGRSVLKHADAKPHIHDLILSMALAECAIAKIGFEKNKVSLGFEALARAQCLLRSKSSLGKMALLSQIEESLEELAPACTLELLGLPHSPANAEQRRGAIAALRELLRQGLDVETSCRVPDWPCFLSQALNRLLAAEIVDLLSWVDLAVVRKNKKSLESQNQRVVIDFNCFYMSLIAHIAFGFSSKQTEVINQAKTMCACLMTSDGIDLKLEETFCLFLLGEGSGTQAVEKLLQLEMNSNPASQSLVQVQGKDIKNVSGAKPSLETWLKDAVLAVFPDTRDCSPSLISFFSGPKRSTWSRSKVSTQTNLSTSHRPMSDATSKRIGHEESLPYPKSTQHLGSAVKQLAATNLQNSLTLNKNGSGSDIHEPSVQLERNLGARNRRAWESLFPHRGTVGKMIFVALLGTIVLVKLSGMNVRRMSTASRLVSTKSGMSSSSLGWTADSSLDYNVGPAYISQSGISGKMRKLLAMVKMQFWDHSDPEKQPIARLATGVSTSLAMASRKQMPVKEAESLVKYWQKIKADALGPGHQVHSLSEILDESMLSQWQDLADAAKARSCYWRFVLLQTSIRQADIWSDGFGAEIAEIEALLEEAAELVDECQQNNPNYYSKYRIRYLLKRQGDGSWRFCEADIETPS